MSLLEGGLQQIFGSVFGGLFPAGRLHKMLVTPNGAGGLTRTEVVTNPVGGHPIKVMVESYSDEYRYRNNIPDGDVRLVILQLGVPVPLSLDDEITALGPTGVSVRYALEGPLASDAARAAWNIRGRPK